MIKLLAPYKRLDNNKRYTLVTGGRGSAKSFHISAFPVLLTYQPNEVILFTRYTMTSAEKSIIPEFKEKIELYGVEDSFHVTGKEIVNRHTGSRIIFSGIKTSSGNQTANLKSIQGLTCWILDEAEEMHDESEFDKIALSVRKQGVHNRIILSMNPCDEDHWIYKRFIEKGNLENCEYIHTTYLDNLVNLNKDFIAEAENTKRNDPEKYKRVFLGEWGTGDDKVFPDGFEVYNEPVTDYDWKAYWGDFGFKVDPVSFGAVYKKGRSLYFEELIYETGLTNPDIAQKIIANGWNDEIGFWDKAEEKSVYELNALGVQAYAPKKVHVAWGIQKLQQFDLYIHENSIKTQKEFRSYRYMRDATGEFKRNTLGHRIAHDKDNHSIDGIRYVMQHYFAE